MTEAVRVSAVSFLNARPLVDGLVDTPGFAVEFDLPSVCAERLHRHDVDLGLIPAIEYLRGDYRLVPDVAIGSDGPILSVAVFTRVPMSQVRRLALDTSSRTSVALTRVLCATLWRITPEMFAAPPDLSRMLANADAALLIGDPALDTWPVPADLEKVDLGAAWQALTGLPFVYAAWAGHPGCVSAAQVIALAAARDRGVADSQRLAAAAAGGDPTRAALYGRYLRDNLRYGFGSRERAGLERFHALAVEVGAAEGLRPLRFYP